MPLSKGAAIIAKLEAFTRGNAKEMGSWDELALKLVGIMVGKAAMMLPYVRVGLGEKAQLQK
jgi:hypothetical protein